MLWLGQFILLHTPIAERDDDTVIIPKLQLPLARIPYMGGTDAVNRFENRELIDLSESEPEVI